MYPHLCSNFNTIINTNYLPALIKKLFIILAEFDIFTISSNLFSAIKL